MASSGRWGAAGSLACRAPDEGELVCAAGTDGYRTLAGAPVPLAGKAPGEAGDGCPDAGEIAADKTMSEIPQTASRSENTRRWVDFRAGAEVASDFPK
jgi:hypothetical protein